MMEHSWVLFAMMGVGSVVLGWEWARYQALRRRMEDDDEPVP